MTQFIFRWKSHTYILYPIPKPLGGVGIDWIYAISQKRTYCKNKAQEVTVNIPLPFYKGFYWGDAYLSFLWCSWHRVNLLKTYIYILVSLSLREGNVSYDCISIFFSLYYDSVDLVSSLKITEKLFLRFLICFHI